MVFVSAVASAPTLLKNYPVPSKTVSVEVRLLSAIVSATEPQGDCSMVIEDAYSVEDILLRASAKLSVPLAALKLEGGCTLLASLHGVSSGMTVHALDASEAEGHTRWEMAAAFRVFHSHGLAPFDGEAINFIAIRVHASRPPCAPQQHASARLHPIHGSV